jgi:hypothetical protein
VDSELVEVAARRIAAAALPADTVPQKSGIAAPKSCVCSVCGRSIARGQLALVLDWVPPDGATAPVLHLACHVAWVHALRRTVLG